MKTSIVWNKHPSIARQNKFFFTSGARTEGKGMVYVLQSPLTNIWEYSFNEGSTRAGYMTAKSAMEAAEKEMN